MICFQPSSHLRLTCSKMVYTSDVEEFITRKPWGNVTWSLVSYNRHRNEWDGESAKALISFLKVTCATPYRKHTFRLQVAMQCLSLCSTTFSCFQKGIKFSPCIHLSLSRSNKILHGQISALVYVNLPKTFKNKEKCHSSWITWMFFLIRSHFVF